MTTDTKFPTALILTALMIFTPALCHADAAEIIHIAKEAEEKLFLTMPGNRAGVTSRRLRQRKGKSLFPGQKMKTENACVKTSLLKNNDRWMRKALYED